MTNHEIKAKDIICRTFRKAINEGQNVIYDKHAFTINEDKLKQFITEHSKLKSSQHTTHIHVVYFYRLYMRNTLRLKQCIGKCGNCIKI